MSKKPPSAVVLAGVEDAKALDAEASAAWGLHPFALVEAAGRACAGLLIHKRRALFRRPCPKTGVRCHEPFVAVLAGSGNNAADALVMLRSLLLHGYARAEAAAVLFTRLPESDEKTPLGAATLALQKLRVPLLLWEPAESKSMLQGAALVIDGIAGTGINGPLRGAALEMAETLNAIRRADNDADSGPCVVSVDLPSGAGDFWQQGMPLVEADIVLAIEPVKLCIYAPEIRKHAGTIVPVGGIFPAPLMAQYASAELLDWETVAARIAPVAPDDYKYTRGLAEIHAGSPGSAGAARLAALGAQAAGAGLVRLIVDPLLYPLLASGASGIMVASDTSDNPNGSRFQPDAILAGPGWGKGEDRRLLLERFLPLEKSGVPLVLDADAVFLAKDIRFHGSAILTPHAGEFAEYINIPKDEILRNPAPVLRRAAAEKNAHILFKSHVLYIASPDGRLSLIDGMNPALGTGGTGDVLAGLCVGIAARSRGIAARCQSVAARQKAAADFHACACAAAALLVQAARSREIQRRFIDPAELAKAAADIAGRAWLPRYLN